MRLKEWKFDKYRTKKDLGTVVAKVVTCAREEDGDTTFDNGRLIPLSKVENLKERESARDSGAASPNAGKYHLDLKLLIILGSIMITSCRNTTTYRPLYPRFRK